eukprot:5518272-Pleurochrysis_carterae.AAC.1
MPSRLIRASLTDHSREQSSLSRSGPGGPRSPVALHMSATAALADATLAQQLRPAPGGRRTPHAPRARAAR